MVVLHFIWILTYLPPSCLSFVILIYLFICFLTILFFKYSIVFSLSLFTNFCPRFLAVGLPYLGLKLSAFFFSTLFFFFFGLVTHTGHPPAGVTLG